ncbi:hypothetical protein [Bradyrhizobium sp. 21]|uniref:hypothetical protein n=1 Tax=Bradyrhizobium sp. 21 TaxID=2782666 RepID=UPI001FF7A2E6|nr:hypothetical protein [Bradyrhizobium sp. 21]MCK1389016.1 hypothetical protein [Bradyrhizobium sp. 21]
MTNSKERSIEEINASFAFLQTLVDHADAFEGEVPLWRGWALLEAFFAGIAYSSRVANEEK